MVPQVGQQLSWGWGGQSMTAKDERLSPDADDALCLELGVSDTEMLPSENSFLHISAGTLLSSGMILNASSLLVSLYFIFTGVTHTVFIAYR